MTKQKDPALRFCWALQESNIPRQELSLITSLQMKPYETFQAVTSSTDYHWALALTAYNDFRYWNKMCCYWPMDEYAWHRLLKL